jgi:hypothetical protein
MRVSKVNKRVMLSACLLAAVSATVMAAFLQPGRISKAGNDDSWTEAYRSFLEDRDSYINIMSTQNSAGMKGFITGFYLNDMDDDDIPELLIDKYMTAEYVYTYENEAVHLKSILLYDEDENSINMVNVSDGILHKKLVPVLFKEINQENLDKYLVEDYMKTDMYELPEDTNQATEDYWEQLQDRKSDFDNSTIELMRSTATVLSEADNTGKTIYLSDDGLGCYTEDMIEWKYADDYEAAIYTYSDILSGYTDDDYDRYALIYIDEDDVPELIMDKKDKFFVICTYKDGEVYAGEDMNYNFYNRYYSYYEKQNIIQIYYTNGTDWGEEYYHLVNGAGVECFMTVNARASRTSSGYIRVDSQASPIQNYYVDGVNVSHEEYYKKIADISDKTPINMMNMHYISREEMLETLINMMQ